VRVVSPPTEHAAPSIYEHYKRLEGYAVYVVGTGTSLRGFDWSRLDTKYTIALNNAVLYFAPSYHLYSDASIRTRYWKHDYQDRTTIVVQEQVAREAKAIKWKHLDKIRTFSRCADNLGDIPRNNDQLYVERTVATAGIMLAWKLGAHDIYLLGVDGYHLAEKTADGKYVNYADGSAHQTQQPRDTDHALDDRIVREEHLAWNADMLRLRGYFETRARAWDQTAPRVVCASPRTTLTAWPVCTIDEALEERG
jgi:hypothetical protein